MNNIVYNFKLDIDWKLINLISEIDRFDANWTAIERKEGQSLKELKSIATVRSVGASNRIEGNRMSDEEVDVLLQKIDISKLTDRDSQEVVGYFEVLDLITESYQNISLSESHLKSLHNILMKYSAKDLWHKGNYKQHSNAVEASFPDGTKQIIFQTTEAGFATENAIRELLDWYNAETEVHALIKIASFVYEFLSVHPFQDGNGRLSRLISTLLLLNKGYKWIQPLHFISIFLRFNYASHTKPLNLRPASPVFSAFLLTKQLLWKQSFRFKSIVMYFCKKPIWLLRFIFPNKKVFIKAKYAMCTTSTTNISS
jgi:Fic family protein